MTRTTITLTNWKMSKSNSCYIITGVSNSGVKVDIFTQIGPVDRGSHYIIQNVTKTLDIYLYHGEGKCTW